MNIDDKNKLINAVLEYMEKNGGILFKEQFEKANENPIDYDKIFPSLRENNNIIKESKYDNFKSDTLKDFLKHYREYGMVDVREMPNRIFVNIVDFDDDFRGGGLGRKFFEDLTEYAKSKGKNIELQPCDFEYDMETLKEIYRKLGFVDKPGKVDVMIKYI